MTHVNIFIFFDWISQKKVVFADIVSSDWQIFVALTTPFYFGRWRPRDGTFEFCDLLGKCRYFWHWRDNEFWLGCKRSENISFFNISVRRMIEIREVKINDATAATTPQNLHTQLTKTKVLHALHVLFLIPCISFEFSANLRREMPFLKFYREREHSGANLNILF